LIAYVGINTKLIIINTFGIIIKEIPDGSFLESVQYSPDGKYLAYGDEFGNINLRNTSDYSIVKRFTDHTGAIKDIDFNNINGKATFMASASLDKTTRLFNLERLNDPPITNISPYFMGSVEFTPDNRNVFAGSQRGLLKLYPIHPETMADKVCDYLTRQMDIVEWEAFVGSDIPPENTCSSISSSSK
jgi:WD40 repeat protein